MTFRPDSAGSLQYLFDPDDPPRQADRMRAVVRFSVLDEITQEAPVADFTLLCDRPDLTPRVGAGGLMGLVGNPARTFPRLATSGSQIGLSLQASGFLPVSLTAALGPEPAFPDSFAPAELGTLLLHREARVVRGRTVKRGLVPVALAGVAVSVTGVWSHWPAADVDPDTVIEPPLLASLFPGLRKARSTGVGRVRRRDLALAVGQDKRLLAPVVPGDAVLQLSDSVGLAAGDLLALETDRPGHGEYVTAAALAPGLTPDQPARVTLDLPLRLGHEVQARCVRAQRLGASGDLLLTRDAVVGDQVAFLAGLAGLATGQVVEVDDGLGQSDYQTAALFSTSSDAAGFYRLPPVSRVAALRLHAVRGATTIDQTVSLDYRRFENQTDVVFA